MQQNRANTQVFQAPTRLILYVRPTTEPTSRWLEYAERQLANGRNATDILLYLSRSYFNRLETGCIHQARSTIIKLLSRSLNINAQDSNGNTILLNFIIGLLNLTDDAIKYHHDDPARVGPNAVREALNKIAIYELVIKMLLDKHARIDIQNRRGISAYSVSVDGYPRSEGSVELAANDTLRNILLARSPAERAGISFVDSVKTTLENLTNNQDNDFMLRM